MHERGPKIRKKSCDRCQKSKIKCSGDRPQCRSCAHRRASCIYPRYLESKSSSDVHPNTDIPLIPEVEPPRSPPHAIKQSHQQASSFVHTLSGESLPVQSVVVQGVDPIFPTNLPGAPQSPPQLLNSIDYNTLPMDFAGLSDLDWLFQDTHEGTYFDDFLTNNEPQTCNTSSLAHSDQSWPSTSQEPAAKYLSSRDRQCDWPMDGAIPTDRRLDIPKLGKNHSSLPSRPYFFRVSSITEDDRSKLQGSISYLLEKPLWTAVSLANFPSKEKLDHCIDLFFANFRPVVSFIHQPTFDPTNAPVVLILAMTSIGACFTNMDGAQAFAKATAELSRRMLLATEEQSTQLFRTEPYLTSQILLGIYGCSSGDRRLFSTGEACRITLIQNAKLTRLFQDTSQKMQPPADSGSTAQWHAWIHHEGRKRLAWTIYEFDALQSILGNQRPGISTGDITISLPEDTARWDASSAYSWMSLRPWGFSEEDESITFRNTMRSVFEPSVLGTIRFTDVQHIHIIVITLSRFLWSMKELQQGPIMDIGPEQWPILEHKKSLLGKLDSYLVSPYVARDTVMDDDVQRAVQRALIIHTCHLYAASDLMDWLPALLRCSGRNEAARQRMFQWAEENQAQVRSVVYHSAQILAICRDFTFNTPTEAFHAFYAGAVLWYASWFLAPASGDRDNRLSLQIDQPVRSDPLEASDVTAWVNYGNNLTISMYGVSDLSTASGRLKVVEQAVRILQRMRVWKVSERFASILMQVVRGQKLETDTMTP
ncbi:hypothetical protein LTR10_015485 [Elasticomyces elasticus]|uniref:Zn(2)-C6 fungal-type domain-containing protein n=1 Tax=Exophiala sideris TaxID=1016849 RepID=A0ABR0J4C2_9EURO|nr:hypothetical protein LTR10_015485 [Elasticomyces elasticus]KAK5026923.1 hypothetical protein LTS07_007222 [Exophiala sideris]KAK5033927.1 hypothetical protein LTR13_006527 [Exophiala sideris]KAK5055798.1 hypothetical protein LTR69_008173 [Exophiala sideris]KAK5180869.1 hypothetical protein LTR44_006689 [Eurotiomycetes sp. CCFEE 6388]